MIEQTAELAEMIVAEMIEQTAELAEMIEQTAEFRSRHVFIIEFGLLMNF